MTKRFIRGAVLQMAAGSPCVSSAQIAPPSWHRSKRNLRTFVFTDARSGRTGGHNARDISFHNYKSTDGVVVQRSVESYKSAFAASVQEFPQDGPPMRDELGADLGVSRR
jgi:hypothetical protein